MPKVGNVNGMDIYMYAEGNAQHHLPHVHVRYGGKYYPVTLDGVDLSQSLPSRELKAVRKWLAENKQILSVLWVSLS